MEKKQEKKSEGGKWFGATKKQVVLFALIVVALVAINVFLALQPKNQAVSLYKDFAEQTHSSFQQVMGDSADLEQALVETPDMNANEKEDLALMREFYYSMDSDIQWISEKENSVYLQLDSTQNPVQANELMRQEMSLLVVGNYVFALNNDAITDGMQMALDANETVEEARSTLSWIQVKDLLNDDFAQSMISETQVQKADIIQETKDLMGDYLEMRKSAFNSAKQGTNEEYAEAVKLLELAYLLEANAEPSSD